MSGARKTDITVKYNGKNVTEELAAYITDLSYTDAAPGEADDLSITVSDIERKWINSWFPATGDQIVAQIVPTNWDEENDKKVLKCGLFHVDAVDFSFPDALVNIKATAIPTGNIGRMEPRTKAWENATLKTIAQEVAKRSGLKLLYSASSTPSYERQEQTDMTDFEFLMGLATEDGIAIKVSGGQLVLFDEAAFEKRAPSFTLDFGKTKESKIISGSFSFDTSFKTYVGASLTFTPATVKPPKKATDPKPPATTPTTTPRTPTTTETTTAAVKPPAKTKEQKAAEKASKVVKEAKPITATYRPPGAPKNGPILKINASASSQADALRQARNALRNANKEGGKASIELMGMVEAVTGVTCTIKGAGKFDGKYIVESATHNVGSSGYTTSLEIRKVLGW